MAKWKVRDSFEKCIMFLFVQFVFVLAAFIYESFAFRSFLNLAFFLQLALIALTFNFYHKALKNLFYTFWNISAGLCIYYLVSIFRNFLVLDSPWVGTIYFFCLTLLLVSCYLLSSPLYYPLVQWWEYDFRYRPDLRVWVDQDGDKLRARLTDLRRGAGCVSMFHHFPIGHTFTMSGELFNQAFTVKAQIKSKKEPIWGRAIIYGVRFIAEDLEQEQRLKLLNNHWNESKRLKVRSKFAAIE